MAERHIACVARNGVITIADKPIPGTVAIAQSPSRRRLEAAICRTSRRVRGNDVVIPGMRVDLSDEKTNLLVVEFQEALLEQFESGQRRDTACGRASA